MSSEFEIFMVALDDAISEQRGEDVFDLSYFGGSNVNVGVVCSAYDEETGAHFILKLTHDSDPAGKLIRITLGGDGVIIGRSELAADVEDLLIETTEPWHHF